MIQTILVAIVYFMIARLSLFFVVQPESVAAIWPPCGFALAVLLLTKSRTWAFSLLGIFVAVVLANVTGGATLPVSFCLGVVNTLEPLLAAFVLNHILARQITFHRVTDVLSLTFVAASACCAVTAIMGAASLALFRNSPFLETWLTWWIAHGVGILIVTPVIVTWVQDHRLFKREGYRVIVMEVMLLLTSLLFIFFLSFETGEKFESILNINVIALLPVVWAGLRFGPRGASTIVALLAIIDIYFYLNLLGSLSHPDASSIRMHLQKLQVYLGLAGFTALMLAAALSERLHAENAMRDALNELTSIHANIPLAIMLIDSDRRVRKTNDVAAHLCGFAQDEIMDLRSGEWLRCLHALDDPGGCGSGPSCATCKMRLAVADTLATGNSHFQIEVWLPFLEGGKIVDKCLMVSTSPLQIANATFAMVSAQDITDLKRVEDKAQKSEERYHTLFSRAIDGIFILSANGHLVDVNESLARMHGYSVQEMLTMNLSDLDTPQTGALAPERIRHLLAGEPLIFEVEHYHKDGHVFPLEVSASLITSNGESYIQCFHRDITDRKRVENELVVNQQKLVQAEKMAALGRMTAGIGHEMNQPLNAMRNYIQEIILNRQEGIVMSADEEKVNLERAIGQVDRLADIIRNMRLFVREDNEAELAPLLVRDLVDNPLSLLSAPFRAHDIHIEVEPGEADLRVLGNVNRLQQVMINLVVNARDAIETARISSPQDKHGRITLRWRRGEMNTVVIKVEDTGSGVSPEDAPHIFEPFFTTKDKEQGTGLGLAICHDIITRHNGILRFDSTPGQGSIFTMVLPLAPEGDLDNTPPNPGSGT